MERLGSTADTTVSVTPLVSNTPTSVDPTHLSERELLAPPEERALALLGQQRFNLLGHNLHKFLHLCLSDLSTICERNGVLKRVDLGVEGVDEEVDASALEGRLGRGRKEVGNVGVDEELADDGGFGEDGGGDGGRFVSEGWNETALRSGG